MAKKSVIRIFLLALVISTLLGCGLLPLGGGDNSTGSTAEPLTVPVVGSAIESPVIQTDSPTVTQPITGYTDEEAALINLYELNNPSVVHILVMSNAGSGQGSGFVYDTQGHIVTNNHVVEGAQQIVVTFADDTQAAATVVGTDVQSDLAVIQVDVPADALNPVDLGDSEALRVGQTVIAIGNPFGLEGTMTTGIVSALGRQLPAGSETPNGSQYVIPDIVQTDAAINPGNSGGPLFNLQGEVIGVNTAIESAVRSSSGVGYAVPSNIVANVVPQLISSGRVQHPYLGISGMTLSSQVAEALGLSSNQRGVLISQVVNGGPAAQAGLRGATRQADLNGLTIPLGGDIITSVDGITVEQFDDLLGYIVQHTQVGQTITLGVLRDGQAQTVQLTLAARPG
ncbi:MAG: trypsin-like peptidase domain-containing protein [Chloroflexi bacterium]|nr:trypsin-like peptidase domain-containing protein [Chloroflexota bacterium]MBP8059253.1 trypsin-like peptidase domain-containing protein [Chloroflexota bacterium]